MAKIYYVGDWAVMLGPIFAETLGYNVVKPRQECEVLAVWEGSQDPMIAFGQFGKGRVLAYTSDPAPHWGCNFVYWDQYQKFWQNAVRFLLKNSVSKKGAAIGVSGQSRK